MRAGGTDLMAKVRAFIAIVLLCGCAGRAPATDGGGATIEPYVLPDAGNGTSSGTVKPTPSPDAVVAIAEPLNPLMEFDVYVMSKCPYGVRAMENLTAVVAAFRGEVGLNIDYIGRVNPDGDLSSMHGDDEVQGDIDQICARMAAPAEDRFWTFLSCVNQSWREIPGNDEDCAIEAGIDMGQYRRCRKGDLGRKLLTSSFNRASDKHITGSPSMVIAGERYTGSRAVNALTRHICNVYTGDAPLQLCTELQPAPEIELFALTDERCGDDCNVDRMIDSLSGIYTGLKPTVLDWSDPLAKEIFAKAELNTLPALLFTESVKSDEDGYGQMERWLSQAGPYYSVKVKGSFDPRAEICDNGVDDTGNGKVDCADKTCQGTLACRKEKKKHLEVFVMSQCPFGAMALLAMPEVKEAFPKKDMRFEIHFVADERDGEVASMHGDAEVDEDMRWLCAREYFPRDYLDYVFCRAEDYRNTEWRNCAKGKIKAKVIQKCIDSGEGKSLLKKDIQLAKQLDIGASPTWIANGRHKFSGVTANAIKSGYCKMNDRLKGCTKELSDERALTAPEGACGN
ncbi:MAG: hypothetical protein JXX14_08495 [Deltaproteobacteria bacterium]|nr:hypothetical protein [Deltaproteobacteria bacterium]